ncbi:MAG TPA: ABC transporter substrate-binding protein, partial [Spirochaetia bacterium]
MRNVVILMTAILSAAPLAAQSTAKGPLVDRIQLETRPLEDACLKEVAAGRADLCASLVGSAALATLPDEARAGLDIFPVTGTGTLSLLLNPWPDRAPFTTTDRDGRVRFNPLAIRDVRFALNILIDRSRIIGDSLAGAGQPQLIPVGPGLPDASRWAAIPTRLGVTATGDEGRAIAAITAAMSAAAALPENAGRLVRGAPWWTFDGEPVTLRFVIRNDDQDVRLGVGRAIADSIERTGIRVERMEMGRAAARRLWAQSDPRERLWDLYTEAWSGRTVTAWLDGIATDMYAPRGGNMTGAGIPGAWAYADPDVDALSVAAAGAANATEYAARLSDLLTRGLESSVRIFIAARTSFIVANKGREAGRMIVGPADGMNAWSLATFDLRPQKDASLRMIAVAPAGSLATSPWDPIGAGGFTDEGSALLVDAVSDRETEPNPVTGTDMPIWASWSRVKSSIVAGVNGAPVGKIAVPPTAVLWNAKRGAWEKGIVFGPADDASRAWGYRPAASITACSQATFAFRSGEWHDGRLIDINDYRYALSLPWDVAFRSGDDDRLYDADYAAARGAVLSRYKGFVFDRDGTITVYGDAVFPSDQGHLAALLCPRLAVGASGVGVAVPWEVLEAVRSIVTDGGASK